MQVNKIKSYMALHDKTIKSLAKEMGISSKSLSDKLLGKRVFTVPEANKIVEILEIENPADIFFK